MTFEKLDCFSIQYLYICHNDVTYQVTFQKTCLTNLFFQSSDIDCQYKTIKQNFHIHNFIDMGLIMFSSEGLNVRLKCGNKTDKKTLIGSYLLRPPNDCTLVFDVFEYNNAMRLEESHLVDVIPTISCCSQYFNSSSFSKQINNTIILRSLYDIKIYDDVNLTDELVEWTKFKAVSFKDSEKPWYFEISVTIVLLLIIILFVWLRFKHMLCR